MLVRPLLYWATRSLVEEEGFRVSLIVQEDMKSMWMSFVLWKEMTPGGLETANQGLISNERRKWSVMWNSSAVQLEGVRPEQQIKSRVWPLMCVWWSLRAAGSRNCRVMRSLEWGEEQYWVCVYWIPPAELHKVRKWHGSYKLRTTQSYNQKSHRHRSWS